MEFLEWCGRHPIITILALWAVSELILKGLNRTYRMIMVSIRGWPPAHLDADGDWKPIPKPEEES